MKIRNGFVSNSSSSSFILVSNRGAYRKALEELKDYAKVTKKWGNIGVRITLPIKKGNFNFGRQFMTYRTLADRLNFITYHILMDSVYGSKHYREYELLEAVLTKAVNETVPLVDTFLDIKFDYNSIFYDGVGKGKLDIDHQSDVEENKSMFKDEDTLYNFLFNEESAIYNGSDEEYPTFEYEEGVHKYKEINGEYPYCCDEESLNFDGKEFIQKHENEHSPFDDPVMMWHYYGKHEFSDYEKRDLRKWKKYSQPFFDKLEKEGKLETFEEWCRKEYGG